MLKQILLAGSVMIAGPVLAQTSGDATQTRTQAQPNGVTAPNGAITTTPAPSAPAPTTSPAPTGDAMTGQTSPATPAPTTPAEPAVADSTVEPGTTPSAQATPTPAQPAPQTAAAGGSQVEQIVGREFGAYDKDRDGKLSQVEFDTWMVALKTASDPATRADAPATKQWLGAAFAQADADKSRDLTQAELTGFLSQGQS